MPLVSLEFERPEDVSERHHRRFTNVAGRTALEGYRNRRLGRHFQDVPETQPGGELRYVQRSRGYLKRKQRRVGHTRPNDFTGQTKRIARRSPVRATYLNATLTIRPNFQARNREAFAGFVENKRRQRAGFVTSRRAAQASARLKQRIAELESLSRGDQQSLGDAYSATYGEQLQQHRATRKRTRIT